VRNTPQARRRLTLSAQCLNIVSIWAINSNQITRY
jgi:hypothetical protein